MRPYAGMKIDLSKELNPEQARAAEKIEGPELIIAGAGSGKTRMITYRIAHMLDEGIRSRNILALTFTNKAAREMKERIQGLLGKAASDLTATTFHSFGLGILKQYIQHLGYHNDFTIYDENDNQALLKNCIVTCGYQIPDYDTYSLLHTFSDVKTGRASIDMDNSAVGQIYKEWILTQKAYNVVDFDDLILLPIRIFEKKPFVLAEVQDRFRYIMVDEFQDTSLLQYRMVSMIAEKYRNIAVVGDDDQSIYSWRGANYRNIEQFEEDFPEREEFKLERNYRSTGNILTAANSLIVHNKERKAKKLWTEVGSGSAISIKGHKTNEKEAYWIGMQIKQDIKQRDINYSDIGVLVRTNSLISDLENTFTEQGIPTRISGGKSFFDRREIRDVLCYLKVLVNRNDDVSLLRIINTPRRGIGRTTIEKLRKTADDGFLSLFDAMERLSASPDIQTRTRDSLRRFLEFIRTWTEKGSSAPGRELIMSLVSEIGYRGMLEEEFPESPKTVDYKMHGIEILQSRLNRYLERNPDSSLRDYVNAVSVIGDENDDSDNKVNLMTMHASKGLEFRIVYLSGIEDNIIPSSRALEENPGNIDEERRLFYVAITRARERLVINYSERRTNRMGEEKSALPSRFLEEIPSELFKNEEKSPEQLKKEQLEALRKLLRRNQA